MAGFTIHNAEGKLLRTEGCQSIGKARQLTERIIKNIPLGYVIILWAEGFPVESACND